MNGIGIEWNREKDRKTSEYQVLLHFDSLDSLKSINGDQIRQYIQWGRIFKDDQKQHQESS